MRNKMASSTVARAKAGNRTGAVAVEFAFMAVLLVSLILGLTEISRGIMVNEILSNAARAGCRIGIEGTGTNAEVISEVKQILSDNNLNADAATITILVEDKAADVATAKRYDKITVTVSIPVSQVYWSSVVFLESDFQLSESVVMMRQY